MSLDVPLLRSSFALVVEREANVTARFYAILFERYPQAKAMFGRHSTQAQERMLTEALVAVIDHLDDAPWLAEALGDLGARHAGYGVTDEMYDWVGSALLQALAEVAGDDWSDQLRDAWTDAYGAIASLMQAGTARAVA